jgi:hypothetical protein
MQRVAISSHLRGEATQPSGAPPQVDVTSNSESVEAMAADGSDPGIDRVAYQTHATFTGESTFTEMGTIKIDDGDAEVDIVTVGEGTLSASGDPELMHGSVIWRITEGRGRFEGASGLITSNFLLRPATGEVDERQVAVVFLP